MPNKSFEKSPLISIIMIARNAGETLPLAITSLRRQTYENWECLIVDDASQDHTRQLLEQLQDRRFTPIFSRVHLGRGAARNLALDQAKGNYITNLDADDFLFPNALKQQVQILEESPCLAACTGSVFLFTPDYRPVGRRRSQICPGLYTITTPLTTRLPLAPTVLRTRHIGSCRFNEKLQRSEDRDFYDRVLNRKRLLVLQELTYAYRWNLSYNNVLEGLKNRKKLCRKRVGENPTRAMKQLFFTVLQLKLYPIVRRLGLWDALNRWRAIPPTDSETSNFHSLLRELKHEQEDTTPANL